MNITNKKFFTGLAAAACLIAVGAMAPKAAKAVYSSPVSVVNTNTAPVQGADVEKLARTPYQSSQYSTSCSGSSCQLQFTSPQAGQRLHLQHITAFFFENSGTTQAPFIYLDNGLNFTFAIPGTIVQSYDPPEVMSVINQDLLTYIDPGTTLTAILSGSFNSGFPVNVVLSGYLENCTITGCPAIQQ